MAARGTVVGNDGVGVVGPVALTGGKIFVYMEIGYPQGAPLPYYAAIHLTRVW